MSGFDAAFFCLGATSAGKTEEQYSRVTYDITMAAAKPLARLNPGMTLPRRDLRPCGASQSSYCQSVPFEVQLPTNTIR